MQGLSGNRECRATRINAENWWIVFWLRIFTLVENKGIGNDGAIGGRGSGGQGSGYEVTRRLKINGFQSDPTLTIPRDVGQKKPGKMWEF